MTAAEFKKKWSRYQGKETSAYQGYFDDLCRLLGLNLERRSRPLRQPDRSSPQSAQLLCCSHCTSCVVLTRTFSAFKSAWSRTPNSSRCTKRRTPATPPSANLQGRRPRRPSRKKLSANASGLRKRRPLFYALKALRKLARGCEERATPGHRSTKLFSLSSSDEERAGVRNRSSALWRVKQTQPNRLRPMRWLGYRRVALISMSDRFST